MTHPERRVMHPLYRRETGRGIYTERRTVAVSGPVTRTSDDSTEPGAVACGLCRYWGEIGSGKGLCHRYPPCLAVSTRETEDYQWCGEFRPKAPATP